MSEGAVDPLLLGQRVVAVLETGMRTATYKLATLMALIDTQRAHVGGLPAERAVGYRVRATVDVKTRRQSPAT